jgi:hypothetical protein
MKKIILTIMVALLSVSAFAAFQYEVIKSETEGAWNSTSTGGSATGVSGHTFTIRVTEGAGAIYIVDKIDSLYGGNSELLSLKADMSSPNNYGWVDLTSGTAYAATGGTELFYNEAANQWNSVVTQTGYKLGDFQAGDEIGVWLTNKKTGDTGASVFHKDNPINGASMNYRNAYVGTDQLGTDLHQLDFTRGGSVFFGIDGIAGPDAPLGQPLPGAMATLLLGGAITGAAGLKKRRKRVS